MYGNIHGPRPLENPITEDHPQNPPSKKGSVRKSIADALLAEHHENRIRVVIGRSADFYGPNTKNSLLYINSLENLLKGKNSLYIGNPEMKHTYTYTKDAACGTVRLALDPGAYGQVWHLPTSQELVTTTQLVQKMAAIVGSPAKVSVMPKPLVKLLKNFIPILKEVDEMTYQTESDYIFSSDKFMQRYPDFQTTSYDKGIREMIHSFTDQK